MGDVSPAVTSLWRLLHLLELEEREWEWETRRVVEATKRQTSSSGAGKRGNSSLITQNDEDSDSTSEASTINDGLQEGGEGAGNGAGDNADAVDSQKSSHRGRRDDAMNSRTSRAKGRTPSPKRVHAPAPPSPRDCPSPVPKLVSTSDISPADHQGWLIDQLRGRKVWCAVSDMLFCVFDNEESRVSRQVIFLPGCAVRHIEFKSASQEGKILNGVARHFASKTISGVDKFQFVIENTVSKQKYMFGVASRSELDRWMSVLARASSLDVTSETTEEDQSDTLSNGQSTPRSKAGSISPRSRSRPDNEPVIPASGYSVCQTLPARIDVHVLSLSLTQPHDVSKDTVDDIRKRLRKEHHEADTKPHPMKAKHDVEEKSDKLASSTVEDNSRKSRSFFKMRSPLDVLLRRKKRSSSADDAHNRRKMFPMMDTETVSNPSFSPRLSDSQSSLTPSLDSNHSLPSHDTSFTGSLDSPKSSSDKKRGFLSRSLDAQKNSSGLGSSLRRTASDLKDKMFGLGAAKDGKSRSAGVKLKDLQDVRLSGCLQYRLAYKFTKVFCVLCRGCFYAFRCERPTESPILAVVLNQCMVTYVAEPEERQRRLFAFKLSQPHCKSIYMTTEEHQTLIKWMMALQTETSKVQVDAELATEIREKRSSQKKRQAREANMSQVAMDLEAKRKELQNKRNSCPDFTAADLGASPDKSDPRTKGDNRENKEVNRNKSDRVAKMAVDIYDEKYSPLSTTENTRKASNSQKGSDNSTSDAQCTHSSLDIHLKDNQSKEPPATPTLESDLIPSDTSVTQSYPRTFTPTHRRTHTSYTGDVQAIARGNIKISAVRVMKRTASLDKQLHRRRSSDDVIVQKLQISSSSPKHEDTHEKVTSFSGIDSSSQVKSVDGADPKDNVGLPRDHDDVIDGALFTSPSQSEVSNSQLPYRLDSTVHDDATKEAWSTNEDFLLDVVKDKLRRRRQREPEEAATVGGAYDVVIVNDQWNATPPLKVNECIPAPQQIMSSESANRELENHDVTERVQDAGSSLPVTDDVSQSASRNQHLHVEGHMERRGFDDQWHRYWCVLRDGFLYSYLKSDNEVSTDVTDLRGYDVTQLIDKFQGKRFVLSLKHPDYIEVMLSLDTREELTDWYQAIRDTLDTLGGHTDTHTDTQKGVVPASEVIQPPSAQTVKEKLLAEMLRQKLELEKIQAARNGLKSDIHVDSKNGSSSPSPGSVLASDDDRICTLTRLRQRRMSTQIKLQAIQKEMEASVTSPREKKTVFQRGKKKPDLVQGHSEVLGNRSDLEEQVRLLSSRLQEIDSCITSHGAISPRDESPARITSKNRLLRHSYDQPQLRDVVMDESRGDNMGCEEEGETVFKSKEKEKEVIRNSGLKSSVQKLAHRTFAKANWHWNKKSSSHTENKDGVRVTSVGSSNNLSDLTPDVIDMTNNNSQSNSKYYSLEGMDIPAPPDNFRTEYTLLTNTLPHRGKTGALHRSPRERILSKMSSSSSLTHLDRFNNRLKSSSSSPSLAKITGKQEEREKHSVQDSVDAGLIPKLTNGSLDDNTGWSAPNSARNQASSGITSPRREVNPNILAEIEAFEELSIKVLGSSTSSK